MTDDPDPATPGARFPYAAGAFCAACVAAAAWTFMLFSWARDVDWNDFEFGGDPVKHPLVGRYVRLNRPEDGKWSSYELCGYVRYLHIVISTERNVWVLVKGLAEDGAPAVVHGRVVAASSIGSVSVQPEQLLIDTTASRWTGASVAGLVVGAMGVFIFALHLRRWLAVRRLVASGGDALQGSRTGT